MTYYDIAVDYLKTFHPAMYARLPVNALAGLDVTSTTTDWSSLINATLPTSAVSDPTVQSDIQTLDAATASGNAVTQSATVSNLSNLLGAGTVTALYNIIRMHNNQQPVDIATVAGMGSTQNAINFLPIAIGAAALILAFKMR